MNISGTITQASQASPPSGQFGVRYQDITITTQSGEKWYGRIGSKQGYQQGAPIIVTVEIKNDQDGTPYNYFKKYNPQYQGQQPTPQNAQQAPSQPTGQANGKKEVDWDAKDLRCARENGLNNATKIICLLAEMTKNDACLNLNHVKKVASELVDYIYKGLSGETPQTGKQMAQDFEDSMPPETHAESPPWES